MRDIFNLKELNSEKANISIEKRQEVEKFIFVGILKPKPNQRVFEIDLSNGEVSEVNFFDTNKTINYLDVINKRNLISEREVIIKEGFDYLIKLNIENAISSFRKKWKNLNVVESIENKSNSMLKNQRKINLYKNK